jgi:putative FmdB family regulatory protein
MPIYEYICQHCGTRFEKLVQSTSSTATIECPECASREVEKAFSTFGLGRPNGSAKTASSCATGSA